MSGRADNPAFPAGETTTDGMTYVERGAGVAMSGRADNPAFPAGETTTDGMTYVEWLAGQALAGLLARQGLNMHPAIVSELAAETANATAAALAKREVAAVKAAALAAAQPGERR